jgi:hypothetical protein
MEDDAKGMSCVCHTLVCDGRGSDGQFAFLDCQ